jgi:CopG antitoxin of type II toxin-antitoxin system
MGENKTSISGASSYREIGEFWDEHDLSDYWDQTHDVPMDIDTHSSTVYFPVEKSLAKKLRLEAEIRGVSAETLLNKWVEEHVKPEPVPK